MSESLRNDGRVWVPKNQHDTRPPEQIPEIDRDYYLERRYPSFGNLVPRDVASRNAKSVCDEGRGVGDSGLAVYLDFTDAIRRLGADVIRARYGNLFDMYTKITDENPYRVPMRIFPAIHYTMGGLWVDYNLMSTIPGLHVLGEANFSDHGANRLGASALMQGLADGYFIIPYTLAHYFGSTVFDDVAVDGARAFAESEGEVQKRIDALFRSTDPEPHASSIASSASCSGTTSACRGTKRACDARSRRSRNCARSSGRTCRCRARRTISTRIWNMRGASPTTWSSPRCWRSTRCNARNPAADISARRARPRTAKRAATTRNFSHVSAWEFQGVGKPPALHKEPLVSST